MLLWVAVLKLLALFVSILLILYNLRRLIFSFVVIVKKANRNPEGRYQDDPPGILILVPCRDEEGMIPGLCLALSGLDYPPDKIKIVLLDDGSRDQTRSVMENAARNKPGWHVLSNLRNEGKASALNKALNQYQFGDFIFVYDADHRPEPGSIKRILGYFQDKRVAGVSGRAVPSNPLASPSAYYATIEGYIHQMVTMRAKDRLDLAPALLGSNVAYRRTSLVSCGGFRKGALLEDSDLTLAFYQAGYRVRFADDAISYHQVPQTVQGYLDQHIRWGRGFNDTLINHGLSVMGKSRLPILLRLELFLFSTGYLDRLALVLACILAILSMIDHRLFQFPYWILSIAVMTPFVQIISLFIEQRLSASYWWRLPWVPFFYMIDIFAAMVSLANTLLNRPRVWKKTERAQFGGDIETK